jgi:predicted  nucleic acid-binding Zn-ribbon protein
LTSAAQEALLVVQAADIELDQLRHQRKTLPERVEVSAAEQAAVAAKKEADDLEGRVAVASERLSKLEAEMAAAEQRAIDLDHRLRSGESTAARDVVRWTEEADHLHERASGLEDQAFDALTEKEELEAALAEVRTRLEASVEAVREGRGRLAGAEVSVDAEAEKVNARRAEVVGTVPPALLAQYDRLRARLGGVGAARLENGRCSGCHLDLSPRDLDELKRLPPEEVANCEACGRILVR